MIDWQNVRRVLVVRLRSIGDTVLSTPTLSALKTHLPEAQVDILLEDWVAPLLEGSDLADNVISAGKSAADRLKTAYRLRRTGYDVAVNLHGGTTGTFFVAASGARHRIGYDEYQYSFLYNRLLSSAADFWNKPVTHSVEQQLALIGFTGVPVEPPPPSRLPIEERALLSVDSRLSAAGLSNRQYALMHPAAALATKQWATEKFAGVAEYLSDSGIQTVAIASRAETSVLKELSERSSVSVTTFSDLSLPEITALASRARLFVGNDSGIAHIAAAVETPSVVIFGSSNVNHWRPWTRAPHEVVQIPMPCQPCPGYECKQFGDPRCIIEIPVEAVARAVDRVLAQK